MDRREMRRDEVHWIQHGNESSGSIKAGYLLTKLVTNNFLKGHCASELVNC
jgi:hypothetical protein